MDNPHDRTTHAGVPARNFSSEPGVLNRLIDQLKHSALFRVLAIFLASGWVLLQIIDAFVDNGLLPAWAFKGGVVALAIGLPMVIATAVIQGMIARQRAAVAAGSVNDTELRPRAAHKLFTWRNAILGGVAAFTLLGMGAGGWMAMRALGIGSVGTLLAKGVIERGAPILLADFESADDADLGVVVTRTLRIDLMQSPAIRVLDPTQLAAPLARMQAAPDTRITSAIATQLAEREGYAAVITGDVARAGAGYLLTASIRAGDGMLPVAGFRETARGEDDLIAAIERLSRAIRDKVGESLRTVQGGESLEQVTTASLPALREYTRGDVIFTSGDFSAALPHFERAVQIDSTFAMAYRRIAATLINLRIRRGAAQAMQRAYALRERLPELERHLTTGYYQQQMVGDLEAAAQAYESARAIDSTHVVALNGLGNIYALLNRNQEAAELYEAALRHRSTAGVYNNLAHMLFSLGEVETALSTVDSGMARLPSWKNGYFTKALILAAQDDLTSADSVSSLLQQQAKTGIERENAWRLRFAIYTQRGRSRDAERALDGASDHGLGDPVIRAAWRGQLLLLRGDTTAAARLVQQTLAEHGDSAEDAVLVEAIQTLAYAGASTAAAAALDSWRKAAPDEHLGAWGWINRGMLMSAIQRSAGDIKGSQATIETLARRCPGCRSFALVQMARTHDAAGNAAEAIAAYEGYLSEKDGARLMDALFDHAHALRRLAELYDAQGNTARAVDYYARFVELWRDADPELQPQVRQAQARLQTLRSIRS